VSGARYKKSGQEKDTKRIETEVQARSRRTKQKERAWESEFSVGGRQTKRLRQGDHVSIDSYSTAAYNIPQLLSDAQNHHYFLRLLGYTFLRFWFTHGCVAFAFAVELLRLYVRLLVLLLLVLVLGSCGTVEG